MNQKIRVMRNEMRGLHSSFRDNTLGFSNTPKQIRSDTIEEIGKIIIRTCCEVRNNGQIL